MFVYKMNKRMIMLFGIYHAKCPLYHWKDIRLLITV